MCDNALVTVKFPITKRCILRKVHASESLNYTMCGRVLQNDRWAQIGWNIEETNCQTCIRILKRRGWLVDYKVVG